jgi:PAS domain S-box-containing protein
MPSKKLSYKQSPGKKKGLRNQAMSSKGKVYSELHTELLDIAPNSIIIHDFHGNILYANKKAFEIHGFTKSEFLALRLQDIITPETAEKLTGYFDFMNHKNEGIFDVAHFKKDKSILLLELFVSKINWNGLPALLSIANDISTRKQTEDEYRLLKKSIEIHNDGVYWLDSENRFIYINDQGCKELGYSREELIGKPVNIVNPRATEESLARVWELLRTNGHMTIESVHRRKDDSLFPVEIISSYVIHEGKEYNYGVARNISKHRQAERTIHQLKSAIEQTLEGIAIADLEGNMLYANKAWSDMHGYVPDEIMGRNLSIFHSQEQLQKDVIPFNQIVLKEGYYRGEVGHMKKNGSLFPTLMSTSLLKDNNENPFGLIGVAMDLTDRQQTIEALKESESRYATVIETTNTGFVELDEKGYVVDANTNYVRLTGRNSLEEIIGHQVTDWTAPYDIERNREEVNKCIKNGSVQNLEVDYQLPDGTILPVEINATVVKTGNNIHVITLCRNITERIQAKAEIERQNEEIIALNSLSRKFNSVLSFETVVHEGLSDLQKILHADLVFLFLLDEGKLTLRETLPPEAKSRTRHFPDHNLGECLCGLAAKEAKLIHSDDIHSDCRCTWEECKAAGFKSFAALPVMFGEEVLGVIGIAWDEVQVLAPKSKFLENIGLVISNAFTNARLYAEAKNELAERLKTETALMASEIRFKNIVDASPMGMHMYELKEENRLVFIGANKAANNMLGVDHSIFIGKTIGEAFPGLINTEIPSRYREAAQNGTMWQTEQIDYDQDGIKGAFEVLAFQTEPGKMVALFNEITNRKKAEDDLVKAKEKAEESDRLKTAFLQNMSHEIRTPMNAITGFADLLNGPKLSDEKRKSFTSIIIKSGNQLLSIVNDILTISALDTHQEKINTTVVNLSVFLNDLRDTFKPRAQTKNITLRIGQSLPENQSIIYADTTKLTQVLTNLLSNAIKFTQDGYIEFGYRLKGAELEFYVEDNGIGIAKEARQHIFERFSQADTSISRKYGGTGLGLAISKGLIELMGGKIWVESEIDKGSTFIFTLPYHSAYEHETETYDKSVPFGVTTILVAEDEEYNFLYLEELLHDLNINIIHTCDGVETIEKCKSNKEIGLILMDIKLPVMDGYRAAQVIKEFRPDLPIIAQSAYALEHEIQKYKGTCFDDYITKPIKKEVFLNKIQKFLK